MSHSWRKSAKLEKDQLCAPCRFRAESWRGCIRNQEAFWEGKSRLESTGSTQEEQIVGEWPQFLWCSAFKRWSLTLLPLTVAWTQWLGSSDSVSLPGLGHKRLRPFPFSHSWIARSWGSLRMCHEDTHKALWKSLCGQELRSLKSLQPQPGLQMTAETRPPATPCPAPQCDSDGPGFRPLPLPSPTLALEPSEEEDLKSLGSLCVSPSLDYSPPLQGQREERWE